MLQYLFGEGTDTPTAQQLAEQRARIEAMQARQLGTQPANVGEGIRAIGSALFARIGDRRLAPKEDAERQRSTDAFNAILSGLGGSPVAPMSAPVAAPMPPPPVAPPQPPMAAPAPVTTSPLPPADLPPQIAAAVDRVAPPAAPASPPVLTEASMSSMSAPTPLSPEFEAVRPGIFAGESGGDYDALFGFSNRPGGPFENVRLTDMTVGEAVAFSDPSGPYAQWVKNQVGRVATPMGAYQVVGSTLRAAVEGLGLTGNERMTPELQDRIGQWIFENQGIGAWEGYRPGVTGMPTGGGGNYSGPGLSEASMSTMNAPQGGGNNMAIIMQLAELAGNPYLPEGQRMIAQMLIQQQVGQAFAPPMSELERLQLAQAQLNYEQDLAGIDNGGTVINNNMPEIGTIPQGFELYTDAEGNRAMRPIPGGPEDRTAQEAAAVEREAVQADAVIGAIDNVLGSVEGGGMFDLPEVGVVGSRLADNRLNQEAVDVGNQLSTIKSAVAFDRLQAMREASPTGGALGAVSDREMDLLSSALGTLSNTTSPAILAQSLRDIRNIMEKFSRYPGASEAPTGGQVLRFNPDTGDFEEVQQ